VSRRVGALLAVLAFAVVVLLPAAVGTGPGVRTQAGPGPGGLPPMPSPSGPASQASSPLAATPQPASRLQPAAEATEVPTTPIRHLVVVMQDGHSFDNYFGSYPGANGIPAGTCLPAGTSAAGTQDCVRPFPLGSQPPEILERTPGVQARQYAGGRMDGFVSAYRALGRDGSTAMGYYDDADIPYYWNVADEFTLFDAWFTPARTGTRMNAFYSVAAVPAPGGSERVPPGGYGDVPTIFDLLQARGIPWKVYVEHHDPTANFRTRTTPPARVPLLSFARFVDDPATAAHIVDLSQYERDLDAGTLPAFSYVVTNASDESPPGRVADGQTQIRGMLAGLAKSSAWSSSAFVWTYDSWGGYYDHVPPPAVDTYGDGFRVPALLVSPYSRRGVVDHAVRDHTAVLRFVEDNWRLPRLGARDTASAGLASAFDFGAPPRAAELLGTDRAVASAGSRARLVVYTAYGGILLLAVAAVMAPALIPRMRASLSRPARVAS
jgi:phospholipase C